MSYRIYTTEAIVCGSYHHQTADRSFLLFTEMAGMLYAAARSVREERSKQRYALQEFSQVRVSLVKGKSGWRIGSVEPLVNWYYAAPNQPTRALIQASIRLVHRLVPGEEAQPAVYQDVCNLFQYAVSAADTAAILDIFTLRTLAHLGYIPPHPSYTEQLTAEQWWQDAAPLSAEADRMIAQGFAQSHL